MKKWAFTLTEVMAIAVIVILLTAMLMPAFMQAKIKARQAVCINNLKEIGQALQLYVQFYDGWIPCAKAGGNTNWQIQLASVSSLRVPSQGMKNTVFYCPAKGGTWGTPGDDGALYSYSVDRDFVGSVKPVRKYSGIISPDRTVYVIDGSEFSFSSAEELSFMGNGGNSETIRYRHGDSANVLFFGGNASSVKKTQNSPVQ